LMDVSFDWELTCDGRHLFLVATCVLSWAENQRQLFLQKKNPRRFNPYLQLYKLTFRWTFNHVSLNKAHKVEQGLFNGYTMMIIWLVFFRNKEEIRRINYFSAQVLL